MLFERGNTDLSGFRLYHYTPSLPAAAIFIVLFGLSTALHTYQLLRTRTWFFIPFVLGGCFEVIGYVARAVSSRQTPHWTLAPFIIQSVLLLVAPAMFAASIYMCLGRIVLMVEGDDKLFVRRTWLTKVFVLGDVISFLMQGGGGGLMSSHQQSSINLGQDLVVGGLFVQIVFFGAFVGASALFHARMARRPSPSADALLRDRGVSWRRQMHVLYAASALILARNAVRVVEYLQGFTGYILEHEVFLYLFDATLMLAVVLMFNWWHPSEVKSALRGGPCMKGLRTRELKGMEARVVDLGEVS